MRAAELGYSWGWTQVASTEQQRSWGVVFLGEKTLQKVCIARTILGALSSCCWCFRTTEQYLTSSFRFCFVLKSWFHGYCNLLVLWRVWICLSSTLIVQESTYVLIYIYIYSIETLTTILECVQVRKCFCCVAFLWIFCYQSPTLTILAFSMMNFPSLYFSLSTCASSCPAKERSTQSTVTVRVL